MVERWIGDRVVLGWNPAAATSLRNFGNSVGVPCFASVFLEETLKAVLLIDRHQIEDHTSAHWKCVTCRGLHILA